MSTTSAQKPDHNSETPETSARMVSFRTFRKAIINSLIMLAGLVLIILFVRYMQQRYSEMKTTQTASHAITSLLHSMDDNTQKVDDLIHRYHEDNNEILQDMSNLFHTGRYQSLLSSTYSLDRKCRDMALLSQAIGGSGYLFVTDRNGVVLLSPFEQYYGVNLIQSGAITEEQFQELIRTRSEDAAENTADNHHLIIKVPDQTEEAYFYSTTLMEEYYLLYGVPTSILYEQFRSLKNIGSVLSNTIVGKSGFVFAIDANSFDFLYFDDGSNVLTGKNAADFGLSKAILSDGYSGTQTINGEEYYCYSRTYSSSLYGDSIVISAVSSSREIYENNNTTVLVTSLIFLLCVIICLFYASVLQTDADQLAHYDENVRDIRTLFRRKTTPVRRASVKNILLSSRKRTAYLKVGIVRSLSPAIVISLVLIFLVSWNAQTMVELSKGMTISDSALMQAEELFSTSETSSTILMKRYQDQYLAKIRLITWMLDEDASQVFNQEYTTEGSDSIHSYVDENFEYILDDHGRRIRSISRSTFLANVAEKNGFDYLFIFDDHGRTIATNTDLWYFRLSDDPASQSYPFRRIITGEVDEMVQDPGLDDTNHSMQYAASVFWYYLLEGDGKDSGRFVREMDFDEFKKDGFFEYDGVKYQISAHRGILQCGVKDETIDSIFESTDPAFLMGQISVDTNGFLVLFDNTPEHVCLWSPYASSIGKTAEALEIPEAAFSDSYKGFTTVNGVEYFQNYYFRDGYWIATTIPTTDLFRGRLEISLITLLISAIFFLIMLNMCIFTTEEEEQLLQRYVEKRIRLHSDNGMVQFSMKNGSTRYTRSAAARFSTSHVSWDDKLPSQKLNSVIRILTPFLVIGFVIIVQFCDQIFGADSIVSYIVHGNWTHGFNYFAYVAFAGTILCVFAAATFLSILIRLSISTMGTRVETIGRLILSVLKYGSVLFSIFYGLSLLGVSTAGLVTSASILSVVIGLGSQSLISDIIAGIFIVFEGSFRVGDIVSVDNFCGMVVDIGLRTTKVEDTAGNIRIYNNSKINAILNMTKKATTVKILLTISYKEDLPKVEELLREDCIGLASQFPKLLQDPYYAGVSDLVNIGPVLSLRAVCGETDRGSVTKDLTRHFYLLLRDNNIICPYSPNANIVMTPGTKIPPTKPQ